MSLLIIALATVLSVLGCDENAAVVIPLEKPDSLWIAQDLVESRYFNQIIHSGDVLYVAAGRDGVFMQAPAFFGEWRSLGLDFPEWSELRPTGYGVSEVFGYQGSLHALIVSPGDDRRPPIRRFRPADSTWTVVTTELVVFNGLAAITTSTGALLIGTLTTDQPIIRFSNDQWSAVLTQSQFVGVQFAEQDGTILYGAGTQTGSSVIFRSTDDGRSWSIPVLAGFETRALWPFMSLHSSRTPTPRFYFTQYRHLYRTLDAGDSVTCIRTFPTITPWLVANPQAPELLVAADSLYFSGDAGITWTSWPSPTGGVLGAWVVDWERRYVPVVEKVGGVGHLYCFNLGLALESQ